MDILALLSWMILALLVLAVAVLTKIIAGLHLKLNADKAQLEQMTEELKAFYTAAAGQVNHIARLEAQLHRLSDKQEQIESHDPVHQSYNELIQLVQRGASVDDLMRRGVRREEAELMIRLHGHQTVEE